jgi:uncharacterized membrane protein
MNESRARSLVKGISWRIVGTIDTIVVSFVFTNHIGHSFKIGLAEILTKIILYYFHERLWLYAVKDKISAHWVSISKGITWRIIGSIDTTILAWIITGNGYTGLKIGLMEVVTKLILYYFHERAWLKVPIGTIRRWIPFLDR